MNLTNAITVTGEAYEDIGKMFEDQPRHDWDRLGDVMHDYRGLLSGWPGILQVHSVSAVLKEFILPSTKLQKPICIHREEVDFEQFVHLFWP